MKLDLHVHSNYSRDAVASVEDLVKACKSAGLAGLAVTDHNVIEGSLKAFELARSEGLVAVRAVEISTVEGHVLAYGVRELIPRGRSIDETVDMIRAVGGIAVAAHPKRFPSGMGIDNAKARDFDAIEVLNGGSSRGANKAAGRVADSRGLPVTGGSDAHKLHELGRAHVVIDEVSSEDEVLDCIRRKNCKPNGRSRTAGEGMVYSYEILASWLKGGFKRM